MIYRGIVGLFTGIFNFIEGCFAFFASQWRQFNPIGQALFALALVMIAVDATISFKFGMTQTWVHAVGFAGLAVALFLLPDAAVTEWRKGNKSGAFGLGLACVPIGFVCLFTHVGYSSGVRLGDIHETAYSKASYTNADAALQDKRETLAMLQAKHKVVLNKQADALTRNAGWTVSVDPTAMQAQLDELDRRIKAERDGKRGRRAGCGGECEKLTDQRNALAAAVALAKEENDISANIQTLERDIAATVQEVASLTPKTSTTVHQVQMAAKLVNVAAYYAGAGTKDAVLNPSAFQQDIANTAAAGISSIAFLLVSATLMVGAGFNRLHHGPHDRTPSPERARPVQPSTSFASSPALAPPPAAAVALAAVQERRDRVAGAMMAMRQARVDGALLATG